MSEKETCHQCGKGLSPNWPMSFCDSVCAARFNGHDPAAPPKVRPLTRHIPEPHDVPSPPAAPVEPPGDYIESVFGADGYLAKSAAKVGLGYQERLGQIALARHIDAVLKKPEHAVAEGPCGTGKGIAYAVPAIYHARHHRKRVIIVTANLALQDQLVKQDLPLLQKALPWPFTFHALKGRSNYFCTNKFLEESEKGTFDGATDAVKKAIQWGSEIANPEHFPDDLKGAARVRRAIDDTRVSPELLTDGDRRHLPIALSNKEWGAMSTNSEECLNESCESLSRDLCHYARARGNCQSADIIVTNMHVLGAHLSVRRMTGMDLILPEHDVVIIDEAHELPEAIREFFGFSISERTFESFCKKIGKVSFVERQKGASKDRGKLLIDRLRRDAHDFFRDVADFAQGKRVRLEHTFLETKVEAKPLLETLLDIHTIADAHREDAAEDLDRAELEKGYKRVADQATALYGYISEFIGQDEANRVYWVDFSPFDRRGQYPRLESRPLEVGGILHGELFEKTDSVVLISATLTTTPANFAFMRGELGVPKETPELAVPSPFDTGNQVLVVVPKTGVVSANPNAPEQIDNAVKVIQEVMELSDGRCLGLFTSYRMLEEVQKRVRSEHPILFQERDGGLNRNELIAAFKEDTHSSLFGTSSFWTGIDVPGDSLTTVIIDKLPFDHQDDPLVEAMKEQFDTPDEETNRFWVWYTNRAILKLRQGVGRLIRSQDDVGVVVVLDRRVAMKAYGKRMVASLGPIKKSNTIADIKEHLATAKEKVLANREAFIDAQRRMVLLPKKPSRVLMVTPGVSVTRVKVPSGVF